MYTLDIWSFSNAVNFTVIRRRLSWRIFRDGTRHRDFYLINRLAGRETRLGVHLLHWRRTLSDLVHSLVANRRFPGRTDEIHHARGEELHRHVFGRIQEECSQSGTLRVKGVIQKFFIFVFIHDIYYRFHGWKYFVPNRSWRFWSPISAVISAGTCCSSNCPPLWIRSWSLTWDR